ncbi:MAG: hypothetical protein ACFCU4_06935 [Puniceicoccaceae bacterium]
MAFYIVIILTVIVAWFAINKIEDYLQRAISGLFLFGLAFFVYDLGKTVSHGYEIGFYQNGIINIKKIIEKEAARALIEPLERFEENTYSESSYASALELNQATSEIIKKMKSEQDGAGQRR